MAPNGRPRQGIYIRWGANRNRADDVAERLGLELVSLRWQTRNPALVPFRHAVQFAQTLGILFRRKPAVVLSHHTQPFCSLAAVLYAKATGADCVTDCHNGPFVDRVWQLPPVRAINRLVFRNASVNLVHNEDIRDYAVGTLGFDGDFIVLRDVVPEIRAVKRELPHAKSVVAITSFYPDEPVQEVFEAARLLPEVHFYVTGNPGRLAADVRAKVPPNVELTGFLPDAEYDSLLVSADVALALSTRDNVLMRACHEAIGAGTPLVVSDSPTARRYLDRGTVYVQNTAPHIARGIDEALAQRDRLRTEMQALGPLREREWWQQVETLAARLSAGTVRSQP